MKWIEKTHGINFELIRHFLATIFDSEGVDRRVFRRHQQHSGVRTRCSPIERLGVNMA